MDTNELSRTKLYEYASKNIRKIDISFNSVDVVSNVLSQSSLFLNRIEPMVRKDKTTEDFEKIFEESLATIKNETMKERLNSSFLERKNAKEKKKPKSFEAWLAVVLNALIEYQNEIIEEHYVFSDQLNKTIGDGNNRKKTFLSYAFKDKGLSLSLYIYFYLHGGFLYVDWMWNKAIKQCSRLKSIIDKELDTSAQLLFLRTTTSELKIQGNYSIRQWCSWEIGNFYTKRPNEKFILDFYSTASNNFFLETFKVMKNVAKGRIVEKKNNTGD